MSGLAITEHLQAYACYPFHTDVAYQKGLESILNRTAISGHSSPSSDDVELRARVFYFNRMTGYSITIEQARHAGTMASSLQQAVDIINNEESSSTSSTSEEYHSSPPTHKQSEEEPRILTFAELQDLIASGRVDKIPNNKVISDKVNDASPSISMAPVRKKPWERE